MDGAGIADAEAMALKLPDQLKMAREYAVLGNYEVSLRYFDLCLSDLTKFARMVGELPAANGGGPAEREKWLAVKNDVASEARVVKEIQRELTVFRQPPGSSRAREAKAAISSNAPSAGRSGNSGGDGSSGAAAKRSYPFGQAPFGRGIAGEEDGKPSGQRATSAGAVKKPPVVGSGPKPSNVVVQPPPPWASSAPSSGPNSGRASPNLPPGQAAARVPGGVVPGRPSVGGGSAAPAGGAAKKPLGGPGYASAGALGGPPSSRPAAALSGAGSGIGSGKAVNKPPLPKVFGKQVGKDAHSGRGGSHDNKPVKGGSGPGGRAKYSEINTNPADHALIQSIESDLLETTPNTRWEDIAGLEEAKGLIQEAVVLPMIVPGYFQGIRRPWK
jgi:hypothetical protein